MQRMRRRLSLAATICGVFFVAYQFAEAQIRKVGPEFQVNTFTHASEMQPRVDVLDNDRFISVWLGPNPDRSALYGVRAQVFQRDGSPVGTEFLITSDAVNDDYIEMYPAIAHSPDSSFVVAWDSYYSSDESFIGAQRFDSSLQPFGSNVQAGPSTAGELWPSVATDATGNFVIVWTEAGSVDNWHPIIRARIFDAFGQPKTEQFAITNNSGSANSATVAMYPDGDFIVTWDQTGRDGSGAGIFGQRFNIQGERLGEEFQINSFAVSEQRWPKVAVSANEDFVVAWQSYGEDGSGYGIVGQRYRRDGIRIGSNFLVNTYTADQQTSPSAAMDATGGFVILWESYKSLFTDEGSQDGSGSGVFGQRFDSNAVPQGLEFQVNTYTRGDQGNLRLRESDVASWSNGDFVAVWTSPDQDGDRAGVFGQRFSVDPAVGSVCGDATEDLLLTASDALAVLRTAIGTGACEVCVCDTNASGTVTATDALWVLRAVLGLPAAVHCTSCP